MSEINHPQLGRLHYIGTEQLWVGVTKYGDEICIAGDDDALDEECELTAIRELAELDRLLERIKVFLASASTPYLDMWARREWELNSLIFRNIEGECKFTAQYLLDRDDYGRWYLLIRDGNVDSMERL